MKILITGGSGFIGTNLIDYYEKKNFEIYNIDIVKPRNSLQAKYWTCLNILDTKALNSFVYANNFDLVIHLAAKTDLNGKDDEAYSVNTKGTENLISSIKQSSSIKKVLFTSSMLVCHSGYIPINDNDYKPTTIYGQSKADMEDIIKTSDLNIIWSIVRPTSIWGPWFVEPYRNFFDIILRSLFFHPGDKACNKTYGYVENTVYQIDKIIQANIEEVNKKVFYLGDSPAINISIWADEIKMLSKNKKNIKLPYFLFVILAKIGDLFKKFNIKFPMTSFRLSNMTTNNVVNLKNLYDVTGEIPYDREEATKRTLSWMKK